MYYIHIPLYILKCILCKYVYVGLPEASPANVQFLEELVKIYKSAEKCTSDNCSVEDCSSFEVLLNVYDVA